MTITPTFGAPKSKIVGGYKSRIGKTFTGLPSASNISLEVQAPNTTPIVEQQQAAPGVDYSSPAGRNINDQQEAVSRPQANPDEFYSDGTDGIAKIGQAATAEATIKANNRKRQMEMPDTSPDQAMLADGINGGIGGNFDGSGNGSGLDKEQLSNARLIAQFGKDRGMSEQDIQIAIMTALTESSLRNINGGDRDSLGLFQQRPSQGWGRPDQVTNPTYAAGKFYDGLAGTTGDPWQRAQAVQRSAFADGSNYKANWGLAQQAYKSLYSPQQGVSTSPVPGKNGSATWINQNNGKYHDYDGQYGAQCVDLYNFYMTGFVGGKSSVGMVNYAQELWNVHDSGALVRVARNQRPQMGDIAIWSNGFNGVGGHVAIVAQDNRNGTIRVLNANATSAGSRGNTVMSNLSTGSLLGYLRPRKLMGR